MSQNKWIRRAAGALLACASVVTVAPTSSSISPVASAQAVSDPGGEFHALTPTRILDTRPGQDVSPSYEGAKQLVVGPTTNKSGEWDFEPLGLGGLPTDASDVLAIVANVTVTQPSRAGFVSVYPKGFEFGGADGSGQVSSLINFQVADNVPNMAIVGLDENGVLTINAGAPQAGTYHLIIDILGFISTSQYDEAGSRLEVVTPGRVLDTRNSSPIGAGQTRELQLRGADTIAIPNSTVVTDIVPNRSSVTAALVNLTLINNGSGTQSTFLAATPEQLDTSGSIISSSNVGNGGVKATTTVVPIAADGTIKLYNRFGNLHVAVDVLGFFEEGVYTDGNRGRIVPLEAPFRSLDTRAAEHGDAPLQGGSKEEWSFDAFVDSVVLNPGADNETSGPPQQGLIGSLVAIDLQPFYPQEANPAYASFLKLTPAGDEPAVTSNINFFMSTVVANMSLVKYGDEHVIEAFNRQGSVDYLLDVYAIVLDD